jgi:hypothetical protein
MAPPVFLGTATADGATGVEVNGGVQTFAAGALDAIFLGEALAAVAADLSVIALSVVGLIVAGLSVVELRRCSRHSFSLVFYVD